jgi:hypothetical protein
MFKHEAEYKAPEVLSDEQLVLVSGGVTPNGNRNIPTCPLRFPGQRGGGLGPVTSDF